MLQNHTLQEFQASLNLNLLNIDKTRKNLNANLEQIGSCMPVGLLINHRSGSNLYMNPISCNILNYTLDEIEELGTRYTSAIMFDELEMNQILPLVNRFYEENDDSQILSFFQKVRPQGSDGFEWMYISSKLMKEEGQDKADRRLLIAAPVNSMGSMSNKISRVLDENEYMKKNFRRFASLTKREKEILTLVAHGEENPSIAEQLFISRHTVEQHRKNIRAKIECKSIADIIRFAQAFDLM